MRNYKLNDRFLSVANFSNLIKHAQQTEGIRVHFGWAAICAFGLGSQMPMHACSMNNDIVALVLLCSNM